jgi:hypothetical protein
MLFASCYITIKFLEKSRYCILQLVKTAPRSERAFAPFFKYNERIAAMPGHVFAKNLEELCDGGSLLACPMLSAV